MSGRRPGWAALMQIGVDSFGAVISDPATGLTLSPAQRLDNLVDEIVLADQVGLDVFWHRSEFVDSAPETDSDGFHRLELRLRSA